MKKPAVIYSVAAASGGFAIERDRAPLKTPRGKALTVPTAALAEAIAAEWRAQTGKINPADMPLTQLAVTAIDIVGPQREAVIGQLLAYIGSELLCHRAEAPPELARQQQDIWQPVLDWCAARFDVSLRAASGIMPIAQPPDAAQKLRRALEAYDDFRLTGLRQAADISGSLVLGLALAERHLTAEQVFEASELDATFQMQKWGEDPAAAKRREGVRKDLNMCENLFRSL